MDAPGRAERRHHSRRRPLLTTRSGLPAKVYLQDELSPMNEVIPSEERERGISLLACHCGKTVGSDTGIKHHIPRRRAAIKDIARE